MRTYLLLIAFLCALPAASRAAEPPADRAHWSIEAKGGRFYPDIDTWEASYGRDHTWQYGASLAYKVVRQLEIGAEAGYTKDRGQGTGALSGTVTGRVIYQTVPLNAFILVRGIFNESQWFVPYAGGGFTRVLYREKIEQQGIVRGYADGYHWRAGLQFLLDNTDVSAARNLYNDYGIYHTYFFTEIQNIRAMVNDNSGTPVNLGGTSYLMGLLFEF
ncbi:MAG: MXAN_2562 family outer membrane beta-barrel protein [Nitrospirota bacterium]